MSKASKIFLPVRVVTIIDTWSKEYGHGVGREGIIYRAISLLDMARKGQLFDAKGNPVTGNKNTIEGISV